MAFFEIRGGIPLRGSVTVSGAKNAALPIICASIMADEPCRIENLPDIEDVNRITEILSSMGAAITRPAPGVVVIDPRTIKSHSVTNEMAAKLRASYYMLGALLGKFRRAEIAQPGGCAIGQRPMDYHINGMRALGANVQDRFGIVTASADKLRGAEIYLDMASVGATINIMLAACRAEGKTVINNAAREPHVVDVANFLNTMGANIRGAGTNVIRITGCDALHGCTYAIIPDQIEAGTFMIAAAATQGNVVINNVIPAHLEAISAKLMECGVEVIEGDNGNDFYMQIISNSRPRAVNIKTLPYPGFPTDAMPVLLASQLRAEGQTDFTETIFENRFGYARELKKLGAQLRQDENTVHLRGAPQLYAAQLFAEDLRGGAALVLAAMQAEGESTIFGVKHIERGYDTLEAALQSVGARLKTVEIPKKM